ncbi:hypothetical protein BDY24DRAFT_412407 [Mrakia frigida]|uniref:uncharacterized protein n=1 Tax=Mrakia frigida TaxID=29902 RepID=UPI003FCC0BFE
MGSFYDPQDVSRRSREPGGFNWIREDQAHEMERSPPSAEELYPAEHIEYEQDRQPPRREESDASLEVMDIAAYAESLRTSSTKYHSQPPSTTFGSPLSFNAGNARPLPSPGPRRFASPPPSSFQHDHRTSLPPPARRSMDYHHPYSPNSIEGYPLDSFIPPFAISRSSASPRPSFDSTLATSSTGYHYDPPPEADSAGYFPPDSNAPHSAQVFASSAPHHDLPTRRETDEPTLDRETLRGFPKWSRDWFKGGEGKDGGGEYAEVGEERWEGGGLTGGDLGEGPSSLSPSMNGEGKLGVGSTIEERIKEKRMKKLEREFGIGGDGSGGAGTKGKGRAVEEHVYVVGELDSKGKIVTSGLKKRLTLRWIEGLFGLATCGLALYGALMIKPTPSPPPSGTLPSLLLCIFSVLSFILDLSLLLIRPLCCSSSKPLKSQQHPNNPLLGGAMLLPMGGQGGKKGKKGQMPGGFQVNLVVDPRAFQVAPVKKKKKKKTKRSKKRKSGTVEELASSSSSSSEDSSSDEEDETRRLSFGEVMAQRERRAWARKWIVRMVWFDVVQGLGWGTVFGVVMVTGEKCPVGEFEGWCECYNSATAGSVLLCLCFLTSFVFGIQDARLKDPSRVGDD